MRLFTIGNFYRVNFLWWPVNFLWWPVYQFYSEMCEALVGQVSSLHNKSVSVQTHGKIGFAIIILYADTLTEYCPNTSVALCQYMWLVTALCTVSFTCVCSSVQIVAHSPSTQNTTTGASAGHVTTWVQLSRTMDAFPIALRTNTGASAGRVTTSSQLSTTTSASPTNTEWTHQTAGATPAMPPPQRHRQLLSTSRTLNPKPA